MDSEEILHLLNNRVNRVGPIGEEIFDLALAYERIQFFNKFRILMAQKDAIGDDIALEVLDWAYRALAES